MLIPSKKMKCPKCGQEHELKPKPGEPTRVILICPDTGAPVYEANAGKPEKGKEK